jgi:hypothetical protein
MTLRRASSDLFHVLDRPPRSARAFLSEILSFVSVCEIAARTVEVRGRMQRGA